MIADNLLNVSKSVKEETGKGVMINGMMGKAYKLKKNSVYGKAFGKAIYLARVPKRNAVSKEMRIIGLSKDSFEKAHRDFKKGLL